LVALLTRLAKTIVVGDLSPDAIDHIKSRLDTAVDFQRATDAGG
jgi:hypothetical protein